MASVRRGEYESVTEYSKAELLFDRTVSNLALREGALLSGPRARIEIIPLF